MVNLKLCLAQKMEQNECAPGLFSLSTPRQQDQGDSDRSSASSSGLCSQRWLVSTVEEIVLNTPLLVSEQQCLAIPFPNLMNPRLAECLPAGTEPSGPGVNASTAIMFRAWLRHDVERIYHEFLRLRKVCPGKKANSELEGCFPLEQSRHHKV